MFFNKEKKKKINLYLPIEGKAREFAPKVYLGIKAVKKDFRVHIGTQESINRIVNTKKTFGGVYFFKGGLDLKDVTKIKSKCSNFVILDEEVGPGDGNPKETMLNRIDKSIENKIDRYYVLGKNTFFIAKKIFKKLKKKIVLSGWPRIDYFIALSKIKEIKRNKKVRDLIKEHGEFILFISDYGQTSMRMVNFTKLQHKNKLDLNNKSQLIKYNEKHKGDLRAFKNFQRFISLLKILDKDKSIPQIIVRPHPLEDHEPWERIKQSFKNIKVIFEGDIEPWIYASKGVMHKGCSSSLQVYYAQKPQAYLMLEKKKPKNTLPVKISHILKSTKAVKMFCIKCVLNSQVLKKKRFFKDMNKIIFNPKTTSSEIIVSDIQGLRPVKETFPVIELDVKFKNYIRFIIERFNNYKYLSTKFFLAILGKHYISDDNRLVSQFQKIPFGINKSDVLEVSKNLNMELKDIKIKSILKNLVILEKK